MDEVLERAGEEDRDPAPLRGDDQGDLVAAAALRAALGPAAVPAARAPALPRRLGFSRAALQERRARRRARRARRLVGPLRQRGARRARGDAEARRPGRRSAARARPRAQAPRRAARSRRRTPIRRAGVRRDARLSRARQQSRPPAPAARARAARDRAAAADARRRASRRTTRARRSAPTTPQPDYVNAVVAVRHDASAARAARARCSAIERRQQPAPRRDRGATRRARSTSISCCSAAGAFACRGLTVPHPRMHERAFVLRPLADVDAAATIPGRGLARALPARAFATSASRARAPTSLR